MVLALAVVGMVLEFRYVKIHRGKQRSKVYFLMGCASAVMAVIYALSIARVVTMQDISGQLFRLGIALLLAVNIACAWIDQ